MSLLTKAMSMLGIGGNISLDPGMPARTGGGFMRSGRGVVFDNWRPALRENQDRIGESWDAAAARSMDSIVNSGWLTGAIEQAVANTVGNGLRLKSQPENDLFGMPEDQAQALARLIEARFALWANNPQECDTEGRRTFGQMQAAAFRMWFATGEILAEIPYMKRPWNMAGTKLRIMSPHRLSRESDQLRNLVNGVVLDPDGMAKAYRVWVKDPFLGRVNYEVNARDRKGRPNVIHVFDGLPETFRGISPMVSVLQVVRQFDQLSDATLTSAIIQTLFAATITSESPTEEILEGLLTPQERAQANIDGVSPMEAWLGASGGYYQGAPISTGINGRIGHLFPGDKMDFHSAEHPGVDYKSYSQQLLREFARALGSTYESATGDYSGSSYYTIGMSVSEIYKITEYRRKHIVGALCQPVYEAWLEEEIFEGRIPFPGGYDAFLKHRAAICRADWRGAPKPQIDDLKSAKAGETRKRMGIATDQMLLNDWCADDIEDVYAELKRERDLREKYDIPEPVLITAQGGPAQADGAAAEGEAP